MKDFAVDNISSSTRNEIVLKQLQQQSDYNKVLVRAKVLRIQEAMKVAGGFTKQDVIIADATCAAWITLWEDDVGSLADQKTYEFTDVVVRSYQGTKYLSKPKEGATVTEIADMSEVAEDDLP